MNLRDNVSGAILNAICSHESRRAMQGIVAKRSAEGQSRRANRIYTAARGSCAAATVLRFLVRSSESNCYAVRGEKTSDPRTDHRALYGNATSRTRGVGGPHSRHEAHQPTHRHARTCDG